MESINILSRGGTTGGYELCIQLSESIANNNGKVTDETQEIINRINAMAENADAEIDIKTKEPLSLSLKNIVNNVQNELNEGASVPVGIKKLIKE